MPSGDATAESNDIYLQENIDEKRRVSISHIVAVVDPDVVDPDPGLINQRGSEEVVKEASKKSPDAAGQKGDSTPPGRAGAEIRSVAHDETLNGDGTTDFPLGFPSRSF